jgi:hypothetical protein
MAAAAAASDDDDETNEAKTPLGEFILSYFDRETGQFPKGPTAVLTMVEKEYGEQYVRPASKFIERIDAKVAEVMGYRDTNLGEEDSELDMVDFDDREHRLEQFLKRIPDGNGNVWSLAGKKFFYAPGDRDAAIQRALKITDQGYDYTQVDHMLIGPIDTSKYSNVEESVPSQQLNQQILGFLRHLTGMDRQLGYRASSLARQHPGQPKMALQAIQSDPELAKIWQDYSSMNTRTSQPQGMMNTRTSQPQGMMNTRESEDILKLAGLR